MFKNILLVWVIFSFIVAPVFAQEEGGSDIPEVSSEVSEDGNVSLDFRDVEIRNVFEILSFKSGVNIVASPDVSGLVSIQLKDVPWRQALDVILQTYGYASDQKGEIIMISTVEDLQSRREAELALSSQEPLLTQTFDLNFAKAEDVIVSIAKIKSERGTVDFDERTNIIIVTDTEKQIELIARVIRELDTTTPQVLIETKIVDTNFSDTNKFGIDWTIQASISGSSRSITAPFKIGSSSTNKHFAGGVPAPKSDTTDFTFGTLDFKGAQAVFEAIATSTDANVLSNPRLVTLDNQKASISVGVDHPLPSFGANRETGQLQTTGITYRNVGINFSVTPHVNKAGYVTLDIEPEISSTGSSVLFQNISIPLINKKTVSTSVMIKDGDTLVIAGLVEDKVVDTKKKIPFLGDIPILGYAFTKKEKTIDKRDLLIFLTPHIITPGIGLDLEK